MKRFFLVEPVIGIFAFASLLTYPVLQQYVYQRLWDEIANSSYPRTQSSSQCMSNDSSVKKLYDDVQKETSLFLLYSELCFMFPSLVVSLLLVSYSDHRGRKIAIVLPLIGNVLFSLIYFVVCSFSLNLNIVLVGSFLMGLWGGPTSLVAGCFAYVADLCDNSKKKTVRMAILEMVVGLLSGVASLSTGYFIQAGGFKWPFLTAALLHCLNIFYVVFFLEETVKPPNFSPLPGFTMEALKNRFHRVYLLFVASSRKRSTLLILMMLAFTFHKFANFGGIFMFIIYELNAPLCWNEILIGYGSALSTLIFLSSFAGVFCFSRCLEDIYIVLIGLVSAMAGLLMAAFAKTTLLMFLVRVPLLFAIMPAPVLRSMMSKIVLSSEQGAAFACLAFLEMVSTVVSFAVFSSIYAATVSWFSGFSFILASGLTVIPIVLMGAVQYLGLESTDETQFLTSEGDGEVDNETRKDRTQLSDKDKS
ncbi:lysosomal proton-coupled steroid conjugate and bile acid symporter SLC46A3 isoform X2 [Lepisosteus oculatus]|uniref:Lysosomal proton-coupled steroid conjugate and bile acid symporter SLC46A3 n=2 Tax=Lepisosteus oculatus TaxID=7918 RepID=W5MQA7_LEPOC|nr:PREDICTED: solute carrier family 46 member 3-like [Lepisosteus oculatus]XP_015197292.1 PREDICTED: solute carrier family 46 member 3-like [Lepisosteus oculatus]XP_015197293.1 PREDICTED: solute carrier family 46 member 3-like [Lepisosteus oculatus]